eukprot:3462261-Amphidinium_carterae.1
MNFLLAEAGLGFTSPRVEAVAHSIAQLMDDWHTLQDSLYSWTSDDTQQGENAERSSSYAIQCTEKPQDLASLRLPPLRWRHSPEQKLPCRGRAWAATTWLHTLRGTFLHNEACRTALKIRHSGHPLDVHGQHAANCSRGPVRARHASIKHTWAQLLRLAGWHVTVEQAVSFSTTSASSSKKADLVAISPGGCTVMYLCT